jgi:uncharacterized protein
MDVFQTVGAVSWAELTTSNPAAATEFYGKMFGWTFDNMDMGSGPYHVIKIGNEAIGGIMSPPPGAPAMPPQWGSYVTVANCDEAVAKCTQLGGVVCMPPMDIKGVGRMAVIQDPQGAVINVISYAAPAA